MSYAPDKMAQWLGANLSRQQLVIVSKYLAVTPDDAHDAHDMLVALTAYVAVTAGALELGDRPELSPDQFIDDLRNGALAALAELAQL